MELQSTFSLTDGQALAISAFALRPSVPVFVDIVYIETNTYVWDTATTFNITTSGLTTPSSITVGGSNIYNNITITPSGSFYDVSVSPLNLTENGGLINLTINNYNEEILNLTSRPAFYDNNSDYYKDYEVIDGLVYPKTIVEIPLIPNLLKYEKVRVFANIVNRGVTTWQTQVANINNLGLLQFNGQQVYVCRKSKSQVAVPVDSDITPIRMQENMKVIEYESVEWSGSYNETFGILSYGTDLLILTNLGLVSFDFYGIFAVPDKLFYNIVGTDLTINAQDQLLITDGKVIHVYKIKHDNVYIDTINSRVYYREDPPAVDVIKVSV